MTPAADTLPPCDGPAIDATCPWKERARVVWRMRHQVLGEDWEGGNRPAVTLAQSQHEHARASVPSVGCKASLVQRKLPVLSWHAQRKTSHAASRVRLAVACSTMYRAPDTMLVANPDLVQMR